MKCNEDHKPQACNGYLLPITDALEVLHGKWKLPILISLRFGEKRFGEMKDDIPKITDRMLSKELKQLEANLLVKRTVYDTTPVTIKYALTDYGFSLDDVIEALKNWGIKHREKIIAK